jgi:hypothetical protein
VSGLKNDADVGSDVKGSTGVADAVSAPLSVRTRRIYSKVTTTCNFGSCRRTLQVMGLSVSGNS